MVKNNLGSMHKSSPLNSLSELNKQLRNNRWIAHIADRRNHYHKPVSIYMRSSFMQAVGGWDSHLWGISMFGTPNVKKVESCGREMFVTKNVKGTPYHLK